MEIAIPFKTQSLACNITPLLGDIGSSSNMALGFLISKFNEEMNLCNSTSSLD